MAHNDEAGGSGGKQFWELSQELEEEPHRYEDAAEDTDPDYTTPSGVGDDTIDGAVMSTHTSILVDYVGPPSTEVCRTAAISLKWMT